MKCEKVKEKLSLYIDDQLDLAESEQIKEHLKDCEECRLHYNKLLKLGQMVDDFSLSENPDYWEEQKDKVLDKIEAAEAEKITEITPQVRKSHLYKYLAVAASLALVAIVSIYQSDDVKKVPSMLQDSEQSEPAEIDSFEEATPDAIEPEVAKPKVTLPAPAIKIQSESKDEVGAGKVDLRTKTRSEKTMSSGQTIETAPEPEPEPVELGEPNTELKKTPIDNVIQSMSDHPKVTISNGPEIKLAEPASLGGSLKPQSTDENKASGLSEEIKVTTRKESTQPDNADKKIIQQNMETGYVTSAKRSAGEGERDYMKSPDSAGKEESSTESPKQNVWRAKLDSLETVYKGIYSPHYIESSAKGRQGLSPDSIDAAILAIADVCFKLGLSTDNDLVREEMMGKLRRLANNGSPDAVEKIHRYIAQLLSAD